VATCEACAVAFTYHQADTCLRCHTCGDFRQVPPVCPGCQDPAFKYVGFGTQRVELILNKCFPQARVARMDADVTARRHSHDEILDTFRRGRADILLGTQMIAKGLHFPSVTLVGVLAADMSLHLPDFRAGERTFQLLAQVSGRAGRGDIPGEVIIQTYTPGHPAVVAAETADFESFAAGELTERQRGGFPPYTRLVCLTLRGPSEEKVSFGTTRLAERLKALAAPVEAGKAGAVDISDALPAPRAKAKGEFRYQILLRAGAIAGLHTLLQRATAEAGLPADVSLATDVDALSIL
jgi:primosomal protein N' (replication factor Y)